MRCDASGGAASNEVRPHSSSIIKCALYASATINIVLVALNEIQGCVYLPPTQTASYTRVAYMIHGHVINLPMAMSYAFCNIIANAFNASHIGTGGLGASLAIIITFTVIFALCPPNIAKLSPPTGQRRAEVN